MVKKIETVSLSDYESPSWAARQAHLNGKQEAYRELISLLTLGDPE